MKKMNSGGPNTRYDEFIEQMLRITPNIYQYEVPLMLRAFKQTIKYFLENGIEFSINDAFSWFTVYKKESNIWAHYRREHQVIPPHKEMKFKVSKVLKDYLNSRGKFKEAKHRENLPDGTKRKKNLF